MAKKTTNEVPQAVQDAAANLAARAADLGAAHEAMSAAMIAESAAGEAYATARKALHDARHEAETAARCRGIAVAALAEAGYPPEDARQRLRESAAKLEAMSREIMRLRAEIARELNGGKGGSE